MGRRLGDAAQLMLYYQNLYHGLDEEVEEVLVLVDEDELEEVLVVE